MNNGIWCHYSWIQVLTCHLFSIHVFSRAIAHLSGHLSAFYNGCLWPPFAAGETICSPPLAGCLARCEDNTALDVSWGNWHLRVHSQVPKGLWGLMESVYRDFRPFSRGARLPFGLGWHIRVKDEQFLRKYVCLVHGKHVYDNWHVLQGESDQKSFPTSQLTCCVS
jgi:hypothetical protein